MIKVVAVNGAPRSGKDTFIDICNEKLGEKGRKTSSIDFVKKIAFYCGWNGEKDLKNRKFLSDMKDILTEWGDIPYKEIEKALKVWELWNERHQIEDEGFLFVCIREPNELEKVRKRLGAMCVLVRRDNAEDALASNHADEEVFDFAYDYIIDNNGDLAQLKESAELLIEELERVDE
jgi:hypothetical protein